jgi:hypothetical protein
MVLIQARKVEDYSSALEFVAEAHPYLGDWYEAAARMAGITLARPLCTAWLVSAAGLEEYDTANELVHRLAHLFVLRRFGEQPYWLLSGLAWHVEWEIRDSIYCFPYRDEFIFAVEHTAWPGMLSRSHDERDSLTMKDFAGWKRGSFHVDYAVRAWGLACFLAREDPKATPAILEDLRLLRDHQSKVHHDDGTWERIVGYESSPADQQAVFERHLGEDFLARALRFFKQVRGASSVKSKVE